MQTILRLFDKDMIGYGGLQWFLQGQKKKEEQKNKETKQNEEQVRKR